MNKFVLLLFTCLSCFSKKTSNKIVNGHFLENLEEGDLYKGQSASEIMNLLGKPFQIPGQENTIYYFKSERKIFSFFPLKGYNKNGTIIIIELDENKKVKEIKKQQYVNYKHTNKLKEKKQMIKEKIKEIEEKIKEIDKNNENRHKKRIKSC